MTDLETIKEIEKKLKVKLNQLIKIEDVSTTGYVINNDAQVVFLGLFNCKITDLSQIALLLNNLKNLKTLYLNHNEIRDIAPLKELKALKTLKTLLLFGNQIESLPSWIVDFDMEIQLSGYSKEGYITFSISTPPKFPPPEIVQQGKEAIKNYFAQLNQQEEDYLFEAKLLILGEPGAGKTSMAWKIENAGCNLPREEDTTKGIEVKQYYFPLRKEDYPGFKHPEKLEGRDFRVNLWDFGGQEIYKATHRFFLSKRSLYALVADSRNEDTDFNYWLHVVELFGGESPLLIILNEKHQRKRTLDIAAMRKRFTNIVDVIAVDFADDDRTRLEQLCKEVRHYVSKLQHIGSPVPGKWAQVREAIEQDGHNTITIEAYLAICKDKGIEKTEDALVLSQYFHDIGVFLHFQDDELLNRTLFLKPNWATNAVYKILDHPLLNKNHGRFSKSDTSTIWHEQEYELIRNELLRLMQKFYLAYEVDRSGQYIVPERLPDSQPKYPWEEKDNLFLRYEYDLFMPKGILSQFIVQMHRYIGNHDFVWRRGVVIGRDGATAEIIETYDARAIKIRISGKNKRDFMTVLTEEFDQINGQYEKMKVEKMIPCNCGKCFGKNGEPVFYEYEDLKRRIEKGRQEVECKISYEMVNVRSLIDEVIDIKKIVIKEQRDYSSDRSTYSESIQRNKVFISYAHKDKSWLAKVQTRFKVLENLGIAVSAWDDTKIKAGMEWHTEIKNAMAAAKVAILLVSDDFLASEFIAKNELPPLLAAAKAEGATIIPVILRPSLYDLHEELKEIQSVNPLDKALSEMTRSDQERCFVDLAKQVTALMKA